MTVFALLSLFVLSSVSWTDTDAAYTADSDGKPISYALHMEPFIMDGFFKGSVTIDFTMTVTTSVLVLNQKDMYVLEITMDDNTIRKWKLIHNMDMLVIYFKKDLMKDHIYRIKIDFESVFEVGGPGFFKSRYFAGQETKWIAATHFEPTGARIAFPCWDEPIYKATFDISIKHLRNYTTVLSNMPVLNRTYHDDDTITTYFERTLPMSTYLVAFIISDYAYKSHDDDRFKIYTKPDAIHMTDLAYNFSVKAMQALDEYTEMPYFKYFPKMDQVTLVDFAPFAMENWGLVTYKERSLLFEEGVSTSEDRDHIITTISHEFAHQWFGNLVSPKWWEFLWLNEGFAVYFHYIITDKVEPTWRYLDLFPVEAMQWGAFLVDGEDSRPMNTYASHPNQIIKLFDGIAYQKSKSINNNNLSGCVIRMFSHLVTEEVFHKALKLYLKENAFNVTDSNTLIKYLEMGAGEFKLWGGVHLEDIVNSWISKSGYPLVTVKKVGHEKYQLSQQKFVYSESDNKNKKNWSIPITYVTNHNLNFTNTTVTHWMHPNDTIITISEPSDWILLNKLQTGYYRVNYDEVLWFKLIMYLRNKKDMHRIHPVNRAQLIDDVLTMAQTNHTSYYTALSLMLYLNHEIDYIPWITTFKHLTFLHHVIYPSKHYHIFKHYIRHLMHSLTKNVTYVASPKDDHPMKVLKRNAMKWACLADVPECLDAAHKEFNAWYKNPNHRLDPDLRTTILCTALRTASWEVWDEVLDRLSQGAYNARETSNMLKAMACSNNVTTLVRFLLYSVRSDARIRFETAAKAVLDNCNVTGIRIVHHVYDIYPMVLMNMEDSDRQIESVSHAIGAVTTNSDDFLWLVEFADKIKANDAVIQSLVKYAMRNVKWIANHGHTVDEWLLDHETVFHSSGTTKTFMSLLLIFSMFNTMLFKIFF